MCTSFVKLPNRFNNVLNAREYRHLSCVAAMDAEGEEEGAVGSEEREAEVEVDRPLP